MTKKKHSERRRHQITRADILRSRQKNRLWLQKNTSRVNRLVIAYLNDLEQKAGLPIERAIIYGSYAKGTAHRWSDVDLCIISKRFRNRSQAVDYLMRRRGVQFSEISPVGFPPQDFAARDPLVAKIKRYGVRITI